MMFTETTEQKAKPTKNIKKDKSALLNPTVNYRYFDDMIEEIDEHHDLCEDRYKFNRKTREEKAGQSTTSSMSMEHCIRRRRSSSSSSNVTSLHHHHRRRRSHHHHQHWRCSHLITFVSFCLHLAVLCCAQTENAKRSATHNYYQNQHYENRDLQQQQRQEEETTSSYSIKYENPTLHWMIKLQNPEDKLLRGNGIYQSPIDPNLVYVTTNSGKLLAVSILDGSIVDSISIDPMIYTNDFGTETWTMQCNSGISFGNTNQQPQQDGGDDSHQQHNAGGGGGAGGSNGDFLVYAIQDIPPEDSSYGHKTRIVAVSIPDHEILWTSSALPGKTNPNNSPLVYWNRMGDMKTFIFMTHNSHFKSDIDNSTTIAGHVTLLDATSGGKVVWTDSEWNSGSTPNGYSPAGIHQMVSSGSSGNRVGGAMFVGGDPTNNNDVVVWSNGGSSSSISDDNHHQQQEESSSRPHQGYTFLFQLPIGFAVDEEDEFDDVLRTKPLKVVRWTSAVPPLFNKNGTDLFIGVGGSQVRGWVGGTKLDETATWSSSLIFVDDDDDEEEEIGDLTVAPVPARLTLSVDENRLFVPSADSDLMCIDTRTGDINWSSQGTSTFLAQSKVSPDDQRVYAIQSIDGRVFSHDQETGDLNWVASCDQFEEDCSNSVHADFEISYTGQFLIYGDVFGRIIALKLGELVEETIPAPPLASPPDDGGLHLEHPSGPHTSWQKQDDGTHQKQDSKEKSERNGAAVVSSVILIILATTVGIGSLYMAILRSVKTRPHPMQEPHAINMNDDDTVPSIGDYSMPSSGDHPDNVLDKYEDSIISRHKVPSSAKPSSILSSFQFPLSSSSSSTTTTTASNFMENMSICWKTPPDTYVSSDMSYAPPADRISALLGTSNRVAPIQEDYSYGAFVLV